MNEYDLARINAVANDLPNYSPLSLIDRLKYRGEVMKYVPMAVVETIAEATELLESLAGAHSKFKMGDRVRKIRGSQWKGRVVGRYSTELTKEGYAVESDTEIGSVQIYPASALELIDDAPKDKQFNSGQK